MMNEIGTNVCACAHVRVCCVCISLYIVPMC